MGSVIEHYICTGLKSCEHALGAVINNINWWGTVIFFVEINRISWKIR